MDAVEELAGAAMHMCRVCGKGFQCGRSLGGHMRSHISLGEAVAEIDGDDELGRVSVNGGRSFNGVVGYGAYGLRENPKKTRRLSDFVDEAKDGGDGEHKEYRDYVDEEFIAEEAEAEKIVAPAALAGVTVLTAPPRRRRRSMRVAAPVLSGTSGFEKELEDVAFCLLKLSRDTGLRRSPVKEEPLEKEVKKTRQPYLYHSDDDSALLQYGDDDIKNDGIVGAGKSKKRSANYYTPDSSSRKKQCEAVTTKRSRYECPGCGKVFSSYQALGGHRASHKRINVSCSAPKVAVTLEPEPSVETYTSLSTLSPSDSPESVTIRIRSKNSDSVVAEKFECPVCFMVFASGQALGGHKRSHVMAGATSDDDELYGTASGNAEQQEEHLVAAVEQEEEEEEEHPVAAAEQEDEHAGAVMEQQEEEHPVAVAGFLDLNFPPAPSEEA